MLKNMEITMPMFIAKMLMTDLREDIISNHCQRKRTQTFIQTSYMQTDGTIA